MLHMIIQKRGGGINGVTYCEIARKEVVNVCDGKCLGNVCNLEICLPEGKITSIIVPGDSKFFGLIRSSADIIIPWCCIKRIGDDVILVELENLAGCCKS